RAVVRARLERHVDGCAPRRLAGLLERLGLGMRPAACRGPAAADDRRPSTPVAHDDRAPRGIGRRRAEVPPAKPECRRHEPPVDLRPTLRPGHDCPQSSLLAAIGPPLSSPTNSSKSFASRKFLYTEAKRT